MSHEYILNFTNSGLKTPITILPQVIDSTSTSFILYGQGYPTWGEGLQENLLRSLEHFADITAPPNATAGQLWYDSSSEELNLYNGTVWKTITGDYAIKDGAETLTGIKTFSNTVNIQDQLFVTNDSQFSNNLTVLGNLNVTGSLTSINSIDLNVSDNMIILNNGETGNGVTFGKSGITIDRGLGVNTEFYFDEFDDKWKTDDGTLIQSLEYEGHIHLAADLDVGLNPGQIVQVQPSGDIDLSLLPPHDHDVLYYTKAQSDAAYSPVIHNHDTSYAPLIHDHNLVYYTKTEIMAGYSAIGHDHDIDYYLKSEVDALIAGVNPFVSPTLTPWTQTFSVGLTALSAGTYIIAGSDTVGDIKIEIFNAGTSAWVTLNSWVSNANSPITIASDGDINKIRVSVGAASAKTLYGFLQT